jgi:hypothetical protein
MQIIYQQIHIIMVIYIIQILTIHTAQIIINNNKTKLFKEAIIIIKYIS